MRDKPLKINGLGWVRAARDFSPPKPLIFNGLWCCKIPQYKATLMVQKWQSGMGDCNNVKF